MDLIEGNSYYIMSDDTHFIEIDMDHFESFKKYTYEDCRFFSSGSAVNVYVAFQFSILNNDNSISMIELNENEKEQKVFRNQSEVMKYLVEHVENLGKPYRLCDELKQLIKENQEEYPERWI